MLSKPFLILLERWIVIPLIGLAISHGFVQNGDGAFWVNILDNVFGGTFIILAYLITHKANNQIASVEQISLWDKIRAWAFQTDKTEIDAGTVAEITPTDPSKEVAQN